MDDLGQRIKHVTHEMKDYVETRMELTMLNVSDKITYWIGHTIQSLVGYTILLLGVLFGMFALSIYLGDLLNNPWAGYAIVGSPFLLIGLIFVLFKPKSITRRIQKELMAEVLDSMSSRDKVKELPANKSSKKEKETVDHG